MANSDAKPLIGLPASMRAVDEQAFHMAGRKYVDAVALASGAVPLVIPAIGELHDMENLVERLDGILFTGSPSNVEPHRYGGPPSETDTLHDPERDATTLPLIRLSLERGLPLFAICRGLQELNVALGGTLHQKLHALPGKLDHREPKNVPFDDRDRPAHAVRLTPGGVLARLAGVEEAQVNTLHDQAIDRLADRLAVEAVAPDGLIEATSVRDASAFALGVQWHPEHPRALEWPLSRALFQAFGDAARARAAAPRPARIADPGRAA